MKKIISRADAEAKGLKRYFTGEPCLNGHISERHMSKNHPCIECVRVANNKFRWGDSARATRPYHPLPKKLLRADDLKIALQIARLERGE